MPTITVEGIPPGLLARLRSAAAVSGRSLNSEVIVRLLRSASSPRGATGGDPARTAGGCPEGERGRPASWRREEPPARVGWGGPPA